MSQKIKGGNFLEHYYLNFAKAHTWCLIAHLSWEKSLSILKMQNGSLEATAEMALKNNFCTKKCLVVFDLNY